MSRSTLWVIEMLNITCDPVQSPRTPPHEYIVAARPVDGMMGFTFQVVALTRVQYEHELWSFLTSPAVIGIGTLVAVGVVGYLGVRRLSRRNSAAFWSLSELSPAGCFILAFVVFGAVFILWCLGLYVIGRLYPNSG